MTQLGKWSETKKQVENILGKEYLRRINDLRDRMKTFWSGETQAYFTLHDSSHSEGVETALYKLIPLHTKIIPLNGTTHFGPEEWFYLIAAAWLHDIGMKPGILRNDSITGEVIEDFEKTREVHHLRSKQFIQENYSLLGLNERERDVLGVICEYHRKSRNINKCPTVFGLDLKLLSAYLRLADGIHINYERVNDDIFKLFELIGMPENSRFHWIKSKLTYDVIPNPEDRTISIILKYSKGDADDSNLVSNLIKNDVKNELYTVRDILIRGGVSYYLDVKIEESQIPADENLKTLLRQIVNNMQLDTWASASDVTNSLISSILYLNTLKDKKKALQTLRKYQERIVKKNLEIRTCHVMLDKMFNMINMSLSDTSKAPEEILDNLKGEILRIKEERKNAFIKIAENAKPILSDGETMLLFGHSKIVIQALAALEDDVKRNTEIYVCEGRNSGRYSYLNDLEYCDGLEYSTAIKELGFARVNLVPDILVGNLFERTENRVQKIIFGANGIDITGASFGHTAGHLTIAKLGKYNDIPVYVLADCYKFGELKYNKKIERDNKWLMGEGTPGYSRLKEANIRIFNPREDKVNAEYIDYLITERGMFPPHKIPRIIKNEYSQYCDKFVSKKNKGT